MKIRMLKTTPGSVDGIRVTDYIAGQEYDLTSSAGERELATALVNAGLADEVSEKANGAAPENKMEPAAPKNKGRRQ